MDDNIATPIKNNHLFKEDKSPTLNDISHIIEQSNCTNTYLHSLGVQITKIESLLQQIQPPPTRESSSSVKPIQKSVFFHHYLHNLV